MDCDCNKYLYRRQWSYFGLVTYIRQERGRRIPIFRKKTVRIMSRSIRDDNSEMGLRNVYCVGSEPDRVMEFCIGYFETHIVSFLTCNIFLYFTTTYIGRLCNKTSMHINTSVLRFSQWWLQIWPDQPLMWWRQLSNNLFCNFACVLVIWNKNILLIIEQNYQKIQFTS